MKMVGNSQVQAPLCFYSNTVVFDPLSIYVWLVVQIVLIFTPTWGNDPI